MLRFIYNKLQRMYHKSLTTPKNTFPNSNIPIFFYLMVSAAAQISSNSLSRFNLIEADNEAWPGGGRAMAAGDLARVFNDDVDGGLTLAIETA